MGSGCLNCGYVVLFYLVHFSAVGGTATSTRNPLRRRGSAQMQSPCLYSELGLLASRTVRDKVLFSTDDPVVVVMVAQVS